MPSTSPHGSRRRRGVATAFACAAAALALTGCGTSDDGERASVTPPAGSFTPPPEAGYVTDGAGHGPGEQIVFANPDADALRVAAGGGHVVAILEGLRTSRLVEIAAGQTPRTLLSFPGRLTSPEIGTDSSSRPVVVFSPCRPANPSLPSPCELASVDLSSGSRRSLAGTRGAVLGDLDHGRVATVTPTDHGPTFAAQTAAGSSLSPLPLSSYRYAFGTKTGRWKSAATDHVESIDFAHDTLAVSLLYGSTGDGGGSTLLVRPLGRSWSAIARTGYGLMDGVEVDLQAVEVTTTGIRAFSSGGPESQPYIARWDATGHRLTRIGIKSRLGYTVSAAFSGDHLITAASDPENGPPNARAVVTSGPYDLG